MEAYVRVKKERNDEDIQENEVRVTSTNKVRNYISYAVALLEEKGHSSVVLKAMGQAINKAVVVAEIIKRRVADIHQITEISSITIIDVWEPTEEGLDVVEQQRRVSVIQITLSKEPLDTSHIGYQPPLPADQVKPLDPEELEARHNRPRRGRGGYRGRGRGGDSNGYVATGEGQGGEYHEGEDFGERGRGRGRDRGRRGRGRGRGRGGPPSGEVEGYAAGGYHDADDGHEGGYDAGEGAPRRPRRNRGPRRGRGRGRGGEGDEGHAHAE